MSSKSTILTEHHNIQTPCKLFVVGEPQVLLIQPSARHEEKNNGVQHEVELIAQASGNGFAIVFFDCVEWARALMPWADDAVSRDAEVGSHAPDTLRFIEHTLLPWLRERFGALPCIIGGYSLGGLFALWAARNTDAFAAVAAASPSLWIKGWGEYAATHPILSPKATILALASGKSRAETNVPPKAEDTEYKNVADVEAMENRVALVAELKRFYSALLADNRIQPVGGLHYVTAYLATDMIDPTSEPSLYEQLANHTMEISTLKEADLCGSSSVRERIFVTTIHKAKGLEFDNVIVFDAVDGRMPNFYSRTNPQMLAEDARKFYVAISRARRRLYVSQCIRRYDNRNMPHDVFTTPFMRHIAKYFKEDISLS